MRTRAFAMAVCGLVLSTVAGAGEYAGRFTPDANYVLSGRLACHLPALPDVPFRYVRKGYAADRVFRVLYRELRNAAARPSPDRPDFGGAPWRGINATAVEGEFPRAVATVQAATLAAVGRDGKAIRCVEKGSKVVVRGLKMLDDEATFALWLQRDGLTDGYLLTAPGKLCVRIRRRAIWASYYRSPDVVQVDGGKAVEPGRWFHLAVTWGDEVRVYLDGELMGSEQVDRSGFHSQDTDARAEQLILFNDAWGRNPTTGLADEVRFYNRVLTPQEIRRLAGAKGTK